MNIKKTIKRNFGIHKWTTKKGQYGKRFVGVVVKNDYLKRIFEDVPKKDIEHVTICIFGKCFTFTINKQIKIQSYGKNRLKA